MTIKKYKIAKILAILLTLSIFPIDNPVSALDYSFNTNVQFTFNPTLSISISDNLIIDNLTPSTYSDSNIVDINVSTNSVTGYSLSATVGSVTNSTTNLVHSTNNDYKFTSLTSDTTNLSDFSPNTWGYNYSSDNGTTWHNYSSLPLYTNTGTILSEKYLPSDDTIKFKIGAKADANQPAGTYVNTINFYAIAHDAPKTFQEAFALEGKQLNNGYYTMQDMTSTICETADIDTHIQLVDIRDGEIYWIGKAKDNNCWMLQNLKLGKDTETLTLDNTTSNVDANGFALNGKLTDGNFPHNSTDPNTDAYYQYDGAAYYCANSYDCYYNWYTATAGSGTSSTSGINANYDICPSNWSLPTTTQFENLYSHYDSIFSMLVDNPSQTRENLAGKIPGFTLRGSRPIEGGEYGQGNCSFYWSKTAIGRKSSYDLYVRFSDEVVSPSDFSGKANGFAVRCLAK